jgi:hypothetical protein
MASASDPPNMQPAPLLPPVPRIGGTAMPGGVHFSSGNYGTAPSYMLFLTGLVIILLSSLALVLAYVATWLLGVWLHLPLSEALMELVQPEDLSYLPFLQIGLNLLVFLCFLIVLRLSPLSGYHGAEHKVVHCLETYGRLDSDLARACPRAHRRCGTTLLAGILPIMLIGLPLLETGLWAAALLVLVAGWMFRFRVGAAIQNVFTTKEPTDHQLATAVAAADKLVSLWRARPDRRLPLWRSLWVRGFPQMIAGVVVGTEVLRWLGTYLPFWLDWTHVLH